MALQELPVGGRASLAADEKIPIESSIQALNCYLDDDTVTGRNGYRSVLPAVINPVMAVTPTWGTALTGTLLETWDPLWVKHSMSTTSAIISSNYPTTDAPLAIIGPGGSNTILYTRNATLINDYVVEACIQHTLNGVENITGIVARCSTTAQTFYGAQIDNTSLVVTLFKYVAGTYTSLGTYTLPSYPAGGTTGARVRLQLVVAGTSIKVNTSPVTTDGSYPAGTFTTRISVTDGSITSGASGLWCNPGGAQIQINEWSVTQQAAGTTPQGLWRYRFSPTDHVSIVAIGGGVFKVTDPSSETTSDGTITLLAVPFQNGDIISGCQLGRYFYLGNDNATTPVFCRVNPDYTVTIMTQLPQGTAPTVSFSSLAVTLLHTLTPATAGGAGYDVLDTDWHRMTDGSGNHCPVGGSLTYTLPTPIVATDNTWLQVFATPPTQSAGYGKLKIEVATATGSFETLGTISDGIGNGASNTFWGNLNQLTPTTQASIARIRFTMLDHANYGAVYGVMYIPAAPAAGGDIQYQVTFLNSTTGEESVPTTPVTVNYASANLTIPQYHSVFSNYDSFLDGGMVGASPDVVPDARNANKTLGLAWPDKSTYAPVATFTGTIPSGDQYSYADTVRLWRLTDSGWRWVNQSLSSTGAVVPNLIGGQTTYTVTDNTGSSTSQNQLYKAGGPMPQSRAMTSFAGRIVSGYQQRLSCSSYEAFAASSGTDPYPQFPGIPLIDADGFAFDIAPSPKEQIQGLCGGDNNADVLYILTNEGVYVMTDLSPNVEEGGAQSVPYRIFNRGAMGRSAWCYAENMLFWAGYDGIYYASNRVLVDELTKPIRRLVTSWFVPTSNTVVFYRNRKLYAVDGTKYIRYDFVTGRWTEGTISNTPLFASFWSPALSGEVLQTWMLTADLWLARWQESATSDMMIGSTAGTTIPAWAYSTGYFFSPVRFTLDTVFVDVTAPLTVNVYRSSDTSNGRVLQVEGGEVERGAWADFQAYKMRLAFTGDNTTQLRRFAWNLAANDGVGA